MSTKKSLYVLDEVEKAFNFQKKNIFHFNLLEVRQLVCESFSNNGKGLLLEMLRI